MIVLSFLLICIVLVCAVEEPSHFVDCDTTKGPIKIAIYRDWAPLGADRFIELVQDGFYTDIALFRCVRKFLTQFGISSNPQLKHWHNKEILDDPNLHLGIKRNYLSFAGGGPNTRSTQLFIAFEDLDFLGNEPWETPFGVVIQGQSALDRFYKGYGDIPPFGKGPDQQKLHNRGNDYIRQEFPNVDFITQCKLATVPRSAPIPLDAPEKADPDSRAVEGAMQGPETATLPGTGSPSVPVTQLRHQHTISDLNSRRKDSAQPDVPVARTDTASIDNVRSQILDNPPAFTRHADAVTDTASNVATEAVAAVSSAGAAWWLVMFAVMALIVCLAVYSSSRRVKAGPSVKHS